LAEGVGLGVNELDLTEDVARLCTFYILISLYCRLERPVVWKMCYVPIYTVSYPRGMGLFTTVILSTLCYQTHMHVDGIMPVCSFWFVYLLKTF
jgi:hypothetical protein